MFTSTWPDTRFIITTFITNSLIIINQIKTIEIRLELLASRITSCGWLQTGDTFPSCSPFPSYIFLHPLLSASPRSRTSWSQQARSPRWPAPSLIWELRPGDRGLCNNKQHQKVSRKVKVVSNHSNYFRLGDVLSKCPGGANNGFDHNFVMANTEAALNFVCRVRLCHVLLFSLFNIWCFHGII